MMLCRGMSHLWVGAGVGRMLCLPSSQRKEMGSFSKAAKTGGIIPRLLRIQKRERLLN